jgi:hypothetical protein
MVTMAVCSSSMEAATARLRGYGCRRRIPGRDARLRCARCLTKLGQRCAITCRMTSRYGERSSIGPDCLFRESSAIGRRLPHVEPSTGTLNGPLP